MEEQAFKEVDDEKRTRGGKRTFEIKITEVSTSKGKKRTSGDTRARQRTKYF
jgi:hypothetical protein